MIETRRNDLVGAISARLAKLIFLNRYTFSPRRVAELGPEEIDRLEEFLRTGDERRAVERGGALAQEGLNIASLLVVSEEIRAFFLRNNGSKEDEVSIRGVEAVDRYTNACLRGYTKSVETQILQEQEQLRQALSDALEQQRQELFVKNHAIHTSINGIVLTDLEGRITYANPSFLRLWSCDKPEEVVGKSSVELWAGDHAREIVRRLRELEGWHGELTARRMDGSTTEVEVSASMIRDDSGRPVGFMASIMDITERKRLEGQFRQAQKMDALGQLASGIVHDVNNLLTAISGYAQLELMDLVPESPQYGSLTQIKKATDRGRGLTQQLRLFTRQATGALHSINLNGSIEETHGLIERTFPPSISIELNLDPGLDLVNADPIQMSQLLMNLCVNARDAMTQGGPDDGDGSGMHSSRGRLTVSTSNVELGAREAARFIDARPGRYVRISVSDTGVGMTREVLERLFEPFFTTKEESSGMGLGLAVVYGIVRNHHGFIDVRSYPGAGTTFDIYLPVADQILGGAVAEENVGELARGEGTILVVEDEPQVREMVIRTLERCGYSVLSAENGAEAVQKYRDRRGPIDLVVLDMVMPKMGGWECFHQLRRIDPAVRVLVMTGYTSTVNPQQILKEGAVGFIEKPINLQRFSQAIRDGLRA